MRRAPPARSFVLTTARPSVASASVRSDATRLRQAVHVTAERASRRRAPFSDRSPGSPRMRSSPGTNRPVEHRESTGVEGIERHVEAVGALDELAKERRVVSAGVLRGHARGTARPWPAPWPTVRRRHRSRCGRPGSRRASRAMGAWSHSCSLASAGFGSSSRQPCDTTITALRSSRRAPSSDTRSSSAESARCSERRSMSCAATPRYASAGCLTSSPLGPVQYFSGAGSGKQVSSAISSGSRRTSASRCPQVQYFASSASRLSVRRAKVIPLAPMSGVITANRSSSPIRRSSMSTMGRRAACEPSMVVMPVSRKTTNTRRRGSAACSRDSATVFGSRRDSRSVVVCRETRSNCSMVCGTPSSSSSRSARSRSGTGSPLRVG